MCSMAGSLPKICGVEKFNLRHKKPDNGRGININNSGSAGAMHLTATYDTAVYHATLEIYAFS